MECNILLMKPDQARQDRLLEMVISNLESSGYQTVAVTRRQLSEVEFAINFISKGQEHIDYMTGSPMVAILYRGPDAVRFGRNFKFEFRRLHAIDKLRNVLHSTEPGNEFVVQFSLFFPHMSIAQYHQFADQGVAFRDLDKSATEALASMQAFNLVGTAEETVSSAFLEICSRPNCGYLGVSERADDDTTLITYRQREPNRSAEVRVGLLRNAARVDSLPYLKRRYGLHGAVCYFPGYSLLETELLRSKIFECELFCVGGTFGVGRFGDIRVSRELVEVFSSAAN